MPSALVQRVLRRHLSDPADTDTVVENTIERQAELLCGFRKL
jgi:hypothetical protein